MATANFWSVDLASTTIYAYNRISRAFITVPVTQIPEIYDICVELASQQFEVAESDKLKGPANYTKGPSYSYRLPVAPPPIVDTLVFKDGVKTDFKKAQVTGEICMSDFNTGYIEVVRPAYRWPGVLLSSKVWPSGFNAVTGGVGNIQFSQTTLDKWLVTASLNKVNFMYRAYIQDSTSFTYAPGVSTEAWKALMSQWTVDTATVTSTVAAANAGYWDVLTELGELHETVSFIKGCLRSVAVQSKKLSDEIHSGVRTLRVNSKLPQRFGSKAQQSWLAYRYAIMPLAYSMSDIRDMLKAWLDRIYRDERSYNTTQCTVPKIDGYTPSVTEVDIYERCTIRDRYDAKSFASKLSALVSFNPFATAYELMKLSFVLDWFINIGDFVRATTSATFYGERKSCYSWKVDKVVTYTPTSGNGPIVYVTCRMYKRAVINLFDHVGLTSDVFLNWKRQIDAAALGLPSILKRLRSLK